MPTPPPTHPQQINVGSITTSMVQEGVPTTREPQNDGTFMTGLEEEVTIISKAPTQIQSNGGPDAVTSIVVEQEPQPAHPAAEQDDGTFLIGLEEEVSKPTPAPQTSDGSDTFHFEVTF